MNEEFSYFVVFDYGFEGNFCGGNCEMALERPISGIGDVRQVEAKLMEKIGAEWVAVRNFRRFDKGPDE